LYRGNIYTFPCLDSDGNILPPATLYACVKHIMNSNHARPEYSLGVLTSESRDTWASVRERLESLGNTEALNQIDSAFYCIALDDFKSDENDTMGANFLTGDAGNRWFDKNLTLIFDGNGQAAINFEHSWGDGVAVLRFFNEIFDDTTKKPYITPKTKPEFDHGDLNQLVRKLDFKLDDEVKASIKRAQQKYEQAQSSVKLKNFELDSYGRNFVKKFSLSPDSLMQSAIQIAYYKTFNRFVSTYESASTCAFKLGRTETVRPLTLETRRLAEFISKSGEKNSQNYEEVYKLLLEATKVHNQLVKEGATGQGFDRHLFSLKVYE
jgi:carnitine O-palmitoyltransferase 2